MPDYPTFPQVIPGSGMPIIDDMTIDQATDGGVRGRAFFPAPKNRITLLHRLTPTDLQTLLDFYGANRVTITGFSVQWRPECGGPLYQCIFEGPPVVEYANPYCNVTVNLRTL
jgi:hypothetical protein